MTRVQAVLLAVVMGGLAAGMVALWPDDGEEGASQTATNRTGRSPPPEGGAGSLSPETDAEKEVIANILAQQIGNRTLADDELPREVLRRMANRIICESFEEQFRIVVDDGGAKVAATAPEALSTNTNDSRVEGVRVIERETPREDITYRKSLPIEGARPPLRGYRAPILEHVSERWPLDPPAPFEKAAELVGSRLARDGVLKTLRAVIQSLGANAFLESEESSIRELRTIGFPFDLLDHFELQSGERGMAIVRAIAQRQDHSAPEEVAVMLQAARFDFQPTRPGFVVAAESGESEIGTVRAQLTRGDYWLGQGDGGNLDMLREMITSVPQAEFIVSIEAQHLQPAMSTFKSWPKKFRERITLVPEGLPLAQWAQDNGKSGVVDGQATAGHAATIVPRFASRGDDGSTFVPGETFLADGLRAAGLNVFQSPLLFQGGNLLAVRHPKTGERILLIGEAEVHRNTALGLSESQALDAFRVEFGVDRVHKLPTVSFHLDYDVTIRACGDELLAFVNDDEYAARIILQCGMEVLGRAGRVDREVAKRFRSGIQVCDNTQIVGSVWPIVHQGYERGHFPNSFANLFSVGPADSGVGNLHRFWLAADLMNLDVPKLESIRDPNLRTYYESLRALRAERDALHLALSELGMRVVSVPSLAHGARGITFLNGIHARGVYLMPAYGGIYTPLDEAAKSVFAKEMGKGIEIILIRSAESQRRNGAVHCSFAVLSK